MSELQPELFEKQIRTLAQGLDYPRTPEIAGSVMRRLSRERGDKGKGHPPFISQPFGGTHGKRFAWALTVILVLFASLMLIPPVRAAVIQFIQIGVVRIFRAEPTPLGPPNQQIPATVVPLTATSVPTLQPLIPILERLAGEMTLEEAQKAVNYPILLPSYPPDLGQPNRI